MGKFKLFNGAVFTVALVGVDGAGKTTLAQRLEKSSSLLFKHIYMGPSVHSSNYLLPTTRLYQHLKFRLNSKRTKGSEEAQDNSTNIVKLKSDNGSPSNIKYIGGYINRLLEAWYRQIIAFYYQIKGHIIIYDRYYLFDEAPLVTDSQVERQTPIIRLYYKILCYTLLKPDLTFFLDAPPTVLYKRKKDIDIEALKIRRATIVEMGKKTENFVIIDANRSQNKVLGDVLYQIEKYRTLVQSRSLD